MSKHAKLLRAIKSRQAKQIRTPGIVTADCYLRDMRHCLDSGACKRYFQAGLDIPAAIKKASEDLAFVFDQETKTHSRDSEWKSIVPGVAEIPPGTLMVIRNTLTTNKEDRDGDVLETSGALPDPQMPLLWQHLHASPIGKALGVVEHVDNKLTMATCLLDLNDLTEDCAKLFAAGVLRFSHGFRALEFEDRKSGGFRILKFEVIEESAVSVPSNTAAKVEAFAVVKLKSDLMKNMQKRAIKLKGYSQGVGAGQLGNQNNGNTPAAKAGCQCEPSGASGAVAGKGHPATAPARAKTLGEPSTGGYAGQVAPGLTGPHAYGSEPEAEQAAELIGCLGVHTTGGMYYPCRDAETLAKLTADPPAIAATGKAAAIGTRKFLTVSELKAAAVKGYMGVLSGSYQWIHEELQENAARYLLSSGVSMGVRDWVYVIGVFDTYAIVCVQEYDDYSGDTDYYTVPWGMMDGEPVFNGDPKQVDLVTTTEVVGLSGLGGAEKHFDTLRFTTLDWARMTKAAHAFSKTLATQATNKGGRAISAKNADTIKECIADVEELEGMDGMPRSAKALCGRVKTSLSGLVSSTESDSSQPDDDMAEQPKSMNRDAAMGVVLGCEEAPWLRRMAKAMEGTASALEQNAIAKELGADLQ